MDGFNRGERRYRHRVLFAFILVLTVFVHRTESSEETCRTGCQGTAQTFKYEVGTTYKYDYDGKIEISLSSAEGQSTSTEVKAQVSLSQLADCNQLLRLQNVQVLDSKGKKLGPIPDIEKPIKINFHDGHIEDSICVEEGDNQNSINIKRAIASIFQANLKNGYETDVFGRCPTETSSHKEGNILVITKSRGLNKCAFRENVQQDFLASTFNIHSEIKSSPILNGVYGAKLRVKNGVLEQATITEDYLYVPFSVGTNGAKAKITSKLQLTGNGKEAPTGAPTKPKSIIFENPHPVDVTGSNAKAVFEAVKKAAETIDLVVGEETAKEFVKLIKTVRHSSKDDLLLVYNQVRTGADLRNKDAARRLYLDALLRSGNAGSVEAVIELLIKNELDTIEQKVAYIGLNFVRHANEGSLQSALKLLSNPNLPREAYLGIGNLINKYCRQHQCHNVQAASQLSNALLGKLATSPKNREQENDVVYALKALGNMNHLNDNVVKKVVAIAQDKKAASRVRVAALETFLADPCKVRDNALHILQDIQQDSEIRIKAYLALAQCPTAKIANALKTLLEKEPSIQVGGFILSHIRNIRNSADPDKALAQQHLGNIRVQKKFPIDPRKWSFNTEFSYTIDTLGVGASSEANVIYSQNSWLPRSTDLNLTAEIFGHNFNFLEIQTRQENLDRVIEHYLGPKGILRTAVTKDALKEGTANWDRMTQNMEETLKAVLKPRSRRDVSKAEIDHISKQINVKTNDLNKDLDLDLSVKVFGAEVAFVNLYTAEKLTHESIIDRFVKALSKGLDKLQRFEETVRSNLLFLDAEIDYPTSLGFPLKLAVEGSATTQVKAQGAIDVRKLIDNPTAGQIQAKIIPSANIEISGRLTLDALVAENGLRITSSLYTSAGADVALTYSDKGYDFKLGLPVHEQKLISLNHEIVFHTREPNGKEENLPLKFTQVKDWSICVDQLSEFVGLTFCGEINGPNTGGGQVPVLPFPLAGDAKLALSIENDDVKEYRIKHNIRFAPGQRGGDWTFETIGKDGQRKVAVELKGEIDPEKYLTAAFISKARKASGELRLINTNDMKALQARAALDNEAYEFKIGFGVSGSPEKATYKPILEYKTPQGVQQLPFKVEGQVTVERNGDNFKYTYDHVKLISDVQTVTLNGDVGKDASGIYTDLEVSDAKLSAKLKGRLYVTAELMKLNAELQNNANPEFNFNIKGEIKRQPSEIDVALQLIHGPDLSSKTNIITWTSKYLNKFKSLGDYRVESKNKLSYPMIGVNAKVDYELTPKSVDYDVNFEYGDVKFGSELEAKMHEKQKGDYQVEFEVWGLDNKVELKSSRTVLPNDESKIHHTLEINDKKFEVEGKVKHAIRPQYLELGANLQVKIPSHSSPIRVDNGIKVTSEELDLHSKISSGSDSWVDAFLKADKSGDANGNIKVNIKDLVSVQGQIKAKQGAGSSDLLVDVQGGKRQVKVESTFKVQPPHTYDIAVNLYPAFGKDKNLKISFDTSNKISQEEVVTKNKLNVLGNPLEFNAKVTKEGVPNNGKCHGEAELTLPGEQYFQAKINTDNKIANGLLAGQSQGSFEYRKNKNSPGRKVSYKGNWKNTDPKEGLIDLTGTVSADDSNGQNINVDVAVIRKKEGETAHVSYNSKLYGSLMKQPFQESYECKYTETSADYTAKASYGGNNAEIKGAYAIGGASKPTSGNLDIQVQSDGKVLKVLKVDLSGSLTPPDKDRKCLIQGAANVYADSPDSNIVDIKSQGEVIASPHEGQVKGHLALGKLDPVSVSGSYKRAENNGNRDINGAASVSYGPGKEFKVSGDLHKTSDHHYKIKGTVQTPLEGYKNAEFSVETKRTKNEKVDSVAELTVDGQHYKLETALVLSELAPLLDLKLTCPHNKLKEIYVKGNRVNDKQFGGEIRLQDTERNFKLEGGLNVNVESIEDFTIKANLNAPTLNVDRAVFEAKNKHEGKDRKIAVSLKVADKNVISGSTNYQSRQENGRFIIEGSGNFKVKEESQNGNFKVIVDRLTQEKDGETGTELHFISSIGKQGFDSEFKTSNKHFRVQTSYCEEKKTCAYIEIDNKINTNEVHNYNQVLTISADLRKFGFTHEFGIKSATNRKDWVLDYTFDAHLENDEKSKYQFSVALHPKNGHVTLHTPKRVVSLESKINYPENIKNGGKGDGEIAFYIDKKNHANKKTALSWNVNVDPQGGKIQADSKFTHPGLSKPLQVSLAAVRTGTPYNGELKIDGEVDVFAQPNQKVVASYNQKVNINDARTIGESKVTLNVKSTGLKVDIGFSEHIKADRNAKSISYEEALHYQVGPSKYENVASASLSPNKVSALLKVLNAVIAKVDASATLKDKDQVVDVEVASYDNNPIVNKLELKNYNTLFYSVGYKKTPNKKLQLNAALIPGQIADVRADHLNGNEKHNMFHATLKLDEPNFLKPDYSVDSQEIEKVLKSVRDHEAQFVDGLEKLAKEWIEDAKKESKHLGELAKKAAPNLNPLKNYYVKEFKEVKDEILNDKSIKELGEAVQKTLGAVVQASSEILEKINHLVEEIVKTIENSFKSVFESLEKELLPMLKEIAGRTSAIVKDIINIASDIVLGVVSKALKVAEQYQPELKELAATLGELGQDMGRFIQQSYESLKESVMGLIRRLTEEIKASPMIEEIKEQIKAFINEMWVPPEAILNSIAEIFNTIKDTIPEDFFIKKEIVEVLDTITDYADKKLNGKPVDDIAVLEKIAKNIATILKKLSTLVTFEEYGIVGIPDQSKIPGQIPFNYLKNLPNLVAAKFSPISFILKEDITKEVIELLLSLVNRPRNLIAPFPLFGQVIQGQHIFTFGGKHYTFPGNCNYLLARDVINGNFTLVGTYKDGQLQAITLGDHTDSITLQKGGQVKLNKAIVELPTRKPDLAAFRTYGTVNLVSTAGIFVVCKPDLISCEVHISGFYHGQVRGLLGVGNNEPYEDLTLPSGKIVTTENEFANSYKLKANCPDVTVKQEHEAANPACNKLFSWESSLRYCYPFVNPHHFKEACAHGLANGVKNTEEAIATAYVAACHDRYIPISMPEDLLKCTNADKPYSVGDSFSVKLPSKAADIVLIVDTSKENEEIYKNLVQPLVQDLGEELRAKGVSDVEFHLITYGGENQWPSHVTIKGKLTFKGQAPAVKFTELPKEEDVLQKINNADIRRFGETIKSIVEDVSLVTGHTLRTNTYNEGVHYPFRAHALKSIIVFSSKPCEIGRFYPLQKLAALLYKNNLMSINLFTPFDSLTLKDAKKTKDVVGFNTHNVFTLSGGKKNPKGTAELHKELNYDDYCVDFVINNRGNAFSTSNFLEHKSEQTQYVKIAASNIVEQLVNVEQGLDCECKMVNPWTAQNVCQEAYSKERSSKKV